MSEGLEETFSLGDCQLALIEQIINEFAGMFSSIHLKCVIRLGKSPEKVGEILIITLKMGIFG